MVDFRAEYRLWKGGSLVCGNQTTYLLDDFISRKNKISTLFERWGPENNSNALELMFQNGEKEMVEYFVRNLKKERLNSHQYHNVDLKKLIEDIMRKLISDETYKEIMHLSKT